MFTGIVTACSRVTSREPLGEGLRLRVERPAAWERQDLRDGESMAVNGVCLTVVPEPAGAFPASLSFDLSPETLRRSSLGRLGEAGRVNLERALALGDLVGGHLVQGHVDATGRVLAVEPTGEFFTFTFELPAGLERYVVEKGSIALDGISLTVASLGPDRFTVAVIPHTWEVTNLQDRRPGDLVNVEVDVVAKYVERLALPHLAARG